MLDEVQADAADDGDLVRGHGTEELLDGDFLIRNFCVCRKDVSVCYADDLCLQACGFSCGAYVEVWGGQNGLTPQFAAIGGNEADQSVPIRCHLGIIYRLDCLLLCSKSNCSKYVWCIIWM